MSPEDYEKKLRVGLFTYADKRVFSLRRDGQEIQTGTGYKPEHEIEEIIIGEVQGTEPVGTIGVDAHGNVVAIVKKGL